MRHGYCFALGMVIAICAADDRIESPASLLRSRFPGLAQGILGPGTDGFVSRCEGFVASGPGAPDPVRATEEALARRGGLRATFPEDASGEIRFTSHDGFSFSIQEEGARGRGQLADHALSYPVRGGASFWVASQAGYEEWLVLERAGSEPVARWTVDGASLRARGGSIDLLDSRGQPRLTVSAPEAFSADGRAVPTRLVAKGRELALSVEASNQPVLVDPAWAALHPMPTAHGTHTATLLPNGKVLVVGGNDGTTANGGAVNTVELYDPSAGTWTAVPGGLPGGIGIYWHTATLLADGRVVIIGGYNTKAVSSVQTYDSISGAWSLSATMPDPQGRARHSATLLPDGRVLVAGGATGSASTTAINTAEIYDPVKGIWSALPSMATARLGHTATLLPNGSVVLIGGLSNGLATNAVEVFNAGTSSWVTAPPLLVARWDHSSVLLPSGEILVVGGQNPPTAALPNVERYGPAKGPTDAGWMSTGRARLELGLLPDGTVLAAGGSDPTNTSPPTAEIYQPALDRWTPTSVPMTSPHAVGSGTLLPDGKFMVAGGFQANSSPLSSVDLFDGTFPGFDAGVLLQLARENHAATLLSDGTVLITGGQTSSGSSSNAERYDPSSQTWASLPMINPREGHTSTLLPDGTVLIAGGLAGGPVGTCELYGPLGNVGVGFSATGSLGTPRTEHTATLLGTGAVLVAGGTDLNGTALATAEIYEPINHTWTPTGSLLAARRGHTATLLPSGQVLVAGGSSGTSPLSSAELYDPLSATWSSAAPMSSPRAGHTATLLPSGKVLVVGGRDFTGTVLPSAEIYDPATNNWTPANPMMAPRANHTATLLPGGGVAIVGGSLTVPGEIFEPATGLWRSLNDPGLARTFHTATLLTDGTVLIAGGYLGGVSSSVGFLDEGRRARPEFVPTVSLVSAADVVSVTGTGLTGFSEGGAGTAQTGPTNVPLFWVEREDNEQAAFGTTTAWDAGAATFTLPTLQPGPYWFHAVVNGVPSAALPATLNPGTGARLAFIAQPSASVAGSAMGSSPTVEIVDPSGNLYTPGSVPQLNLVVEGYDGGWDAGSVGYTGGTFQFSGLVFYQAVTGLRLVASSPGLAPGTSTPFDVTAGAPATLAFLTQPSNIDAGDLFSPLVTVAVEDAYGNFASGSGPVSLSLPGASLLGTTSITPSGGLATFGNLSVGTANTGYQLVAQCAAVPQPAVSKPFDVGPGPLSSLSFMTPPPPSAQVNAVFPVKVAEIDAYGNLATTSTVSVALAYSIDGGSQGKLVPPSGGVASFGVSIPVPGSYPLTFSAGNAQPIQAQVTILPGPAAQLAFIAQPSTTAVGAVIAPVQVQLQDSAGNPVTGTPTDVQLQLNASGGANLSGTLSVTTVNGVATFNNLSVDQVGAGDTLTASASGGINSATSAPFDITAPAVAPRISGSLPASAQCGVPYTWNGLTATGTAPIDWSFGDRAPAGASIDPRSGVITWTPSSAEVGTQRFTIAAQNAGGDDQASFDVAVSCPPVSANLGCNCGTGASAPWLLAAFAGLSGLSCWGRRRRASRAARSSRQR